MKRSPLLCLVVMLTSSVGLAAPREKTTQVSEVDRWLERQARTVTTLDIDTYQWKGSLDLDKVDVNNPQGLTTSDRKTIGRLLKMLRCHGGLLRRADGHEAGKYPGSFLTMTLYDQGYYEDLHFYRMDHRYRLSRGRTGRKGWQTVEVATVSDDSAARFLGYLRYLKAGARKRGAKMKFYDLEPGN